MKSYLALIALIALGLPWAFSEDNVVVLSDDTFDSFLAANKFVMVKFFAEWCGHCKKLKPLYEEAARQAKQAGKPYVFAEIDATKEKKAAERYGIQGFPTLKFFINGVPKNYEGERTTEALTNFCNKNTGPPTTEVTAIDELKKLLVPDKLRVVLFSDEEKDKKDFEESAIKNDDYEFFYASVTLGKEALPEAKAFPTVLLLKPHDEKQANYEGQFSGNSFEAFLDKHLLPLIGEFNTKTIEAIFSKPKGSAGVILFREKSDAKSAAIEAELRKVAEKYQGKGFIFVVSGITEMWDKRVCEFFGIEAKDLPRLEVVLMREGPNRYMFEDVEITEAKVEKFLEDYKKGSLKRFLKTEEIPATNEGPVYKLVGKSFQKDVMDNDLDIFVKFYAPWCGHCKELAPKFEALAKSLSKNAKLKFMEVDATKNDIEGHEIHSFPVLKLFPGKDKSHAIPYEGHDRTEDGMFKFLKEKASHPIESDPAQEAKAKDEL